MDDNSWAYFPGSDGTPSNDTDPFMGSINDGGSQLDEDAVNSTVLNSPPQPTSGSILYYGGDYRKLLDSVTANNCRMYNRAGALLNAGSGVPSVRSTSPLDAGVAGNAPRVGLQVRAVGKVSGVWTSQWVNPNGTIQSSNVNGGAVAFDANFVYRWEASLAGSPTVFVGDMGCYIGTQLVAVLRGTLNPRRGIAGKANQMCSAEVRLAVATSKNNTVSGTNRLTPPGGISSFDQAIFFGGNAFWAGSDQSLAMPDGPYTQDEYCGYVLEFTALAGIPGPLGDFQSDIGVIAND